MDPGQLGLVLTGLSIVLLLGLGLIFRALARSRARAWEVNRRKQASVERRQGAILGQKQALLWNLIGDELDRRSAWLKSSDLVMGVLREHPDQVLDFLLEQHGERRLQRMLERRIEAQDDD